MAPKDSYSVVLLPGDGIGVEVAAHARTLLETVAKTTGATLAIEEIPCGGKFYLEHGSRDWPEGSEERCQQADAVVLGAVGWNDPDGSGRPVTMEGGKMAGWSPVIGNRAKLDLYANIRPVKLLPGVQHRISDVHSQVWKPENVNMVILRENTEGLYAGMGGILSRGGSERLATDTRVITREASERIIRKAFDIAMTRNGAPGDGKKRVTCIVKNNVLDGCRLFERLFQEIGESFPEVDKDVAIVDAFTQWLITRPEKYDVCVTTNMFGDIVTDLASVLQGGMGLAVGGNVGDEHAMFEPIHGSAPSMAGQDKANPMAMLLATGECLAWLGQRHGDDRLSKAANAVEDAVARVCEAGEPLTYDMVGRERGAPMSRVASAVIERVTSRLS